MKIVLLLLLNVISNSSASLFIKMAVNRVYRYPQQSPMDKLLHAVLSPFFISGAALFVISLAAYSFVLQRLSLNTAYPLTVSLSLLLVTLLSKLVLHESINLRHGLGVGVIVLGIWLVMG